MISAEDQIKNNILFRSLPTIIVLSLLALTVFMWVQTKHTSSQAYQEYFDFRVREAVSHIEIRMATYQQVLNGTRGLYIGSNEVTRSEFRNYVFSLHLEDNFPGIQGVGFSIIIPAQQKEAHMLAVRKEGYPEYNIRPEGDRDPFTSIVFLEPLADRNLRAFGYDMFSEPVRREAMERSRDTDKPAMSGKVRLVQEYGKREQSGFLIYLPVYKLHMPHDTLSNRQANIIGWVYSPFRMDDLMEGIFGEHSSDIDVEIYDGDQISTESLMYDSTYSQKNHEEAEGSLITSQPIEIAGHIWTVSIRALPNLYSRVDTENPLPVIIIGTSASFLFGWLAWLLISGRDHALKIATKMNRQYIESETTLQAILDSSAIGIAWANQEGIIEYVNSTFTAMFGYSQKDVPTVEQWHVRAYPDKEYRKETVARWNARVDETIHNGSHLSPMDVDITCQDGSIKHVQLLGSWAGSKLVVNFNDITERKKVEAEAKHMAAHDPLTGLPNRTLFDSHLEQAIHIAKREKYPIAVLFIDLDKFKNVNDAFGHSVGDILLQEVAKRLRDCLRESDVVSRMGGDEFIALIRKVEEKDVKLVAEKMRFVLNHPFIIDERAVECSASIGIAMYRKDGDDKETLIRNADHAMYCAKEKGRNAVSSFQSDDG